MEPQQPTVPQQPVEAPQAPQVPQPQPVTPPTQEPVSPSSEDPGKTFGILSIIFPFVGLGIVGLVLGILGRKKSKAAGFSNGLALGGIILSILSILSAIGIITALVFAGVKVSGKCKELGPGTHFEGGVTYTCGGTSTSDSSYDY